jgi:hypothetical protein
MPIVLATAYFPSIAYIAACQKSDGIVIEAFETYAKQTLRNRCMIYGPNGIQPLCIPVKKNLGHHTPVSEILTDNTRPWQRLHWRSIETAYNKSPFFLFYRDYFEPFFTMKTRLLLEFNKALLDQILNILRIDRDIRYSSAFEGKEGQESYANLANKHTHFNFPPYFQPFSPKHGFLSNLSIIDLVFNLGPEAGDYLSSFTLSH